MPTTRGGGVGAGDATADWEVRLPLGRSRNPGEGGSSMEGVAQPLRQWSAAVA